MAIDPAEQMTRKAAIEWVLNQGYWAFPCNWGGESIGVAKLPETTVDMPMTTTVFYVYPLDSKRWGVVHANCPRCDAPHFDSLSEAVKGTLKLIDECNNQL